MRVSLVALTAALGAASLGAASVHAAPTTGGTAGGASPGRAHAAPQAADTTRRLPFDIPAQPLARALHDFARQADLQVSLEGAADADVRSSTVAGTFTAA